MLFSLATVYYREADFAVLIWLDSMMQMPREEVRLFRRHGFTRQDVLTILCDITLLPPERKRGSLSCQVAVLVAMSNIVGLIVPQRTKAS